jgi:predicted metal-binding transcription factor (methanogenesis marker protein 9)
MTRIKNMGKIMGPCYFAVVVACLIGSAAVYSDPPQAQEEMPQDWREELKRIDDEIERAEDLKNRYLAAARRAEDEGMRWQFMQNEKQEAKRAFQRAEDKRKAAEMLRMRIDVLKARKAEILKEHPEANGTE